MIYNVHLKNFGPLEDLKLTNFGRINLIVGGNSTGKTFLLKALYTAMRTLEDYKRGNDPRTASEILAEKLYWTFQPDKIGDLVTKGANGPLSFQFDYDERHFTYSFGKDTSKQITSLENHTLPRESNSVFLPAKEVLSLHRIILKSREQDVVFGFDDTYLDLARALNRPTSKGGNLPEFAQVRVDLEETLGGRVKYFPGVGWLFQKGNQKFPMGVTAEGIKKLGILDVMLGNRHLDKNAIVFIDEPESNQHPEAISKLLDMVEKLSGCGIQFFLASHSYFVVKKLYLIAQSKNLSIPIISASDDGWNQDDLLKGMPSNRIIDESIRLFEAEMGLGLE